MKMKRRLAFAELRHHPARSAILWLAITVATTLLSTAIGARSILHREIPRSFAAATPPALIVSTDDADRAARHLRDTALPIRALESRRVIRARARVAPGDWRALRLFVVPDFAALAVSRIYPVAGAWPPAPGAVLVERSALGVLRTAPGGTLTIRLPDRPSIVELPVTGTVYDPAQAPGWQDDVGYAYLTPDTLRRLGLDPRLDELHIAADGDRADAARLATAVRDHLRRASIPVAIEVSARTHPHADHMTAMLVLLALQSAFALLLAATLAANLIAAAVTRQTRQIGILRALGARRRDIAAIYLTMVGLTALAAILPAAPLSAALAARFARFAADQLNLALTDATPSPAALLAVAAAALFVPLIAAVLPAYRALRMSTRAALRDVGIIEPAPATRTRPARALSQSLSVLTRLSLRNTTRRPARVALTVLSLAIGGAMLLTAVNVDRSLMRAVDDALATRGDDLEVRLLRPAPAAGLAETISAIDGIRAAALWPAARIGLHAGPDTDGLIHGRYALLAPPDARPPGATLTAGRWPRPRPARDPVEVIVNRQLLALEPTLAPPAPASIHLGPRVTPALVVGVVEELAPPTLYLHPAAATLALGAPPAAPSIGGLRIIAPDHTAAIAARLEDALVARGWLPVYAMTRTALRRALIDHFAILLTVLLAIAIAALIVGGLGLATTLTLNVLDRTRELGILRALGADDHHLRGLILTEGLTLTALSVFTAALLALPLTLAVVRLIGPHTLHIALPFTLAPAGLALWITVAAAIGWIACRWPAALAMRCPTRQLLARE